MKHKLYLFITILFICNCSPKIRTIISNSDYKKLDDNIDIIFINESEVPENSKYIGELKIGDSGFTTDCGYEKIMNEAKIEAKKLGGNIIQVIEIKEPQKWGSTCYRLKAKIFRNLDSKLLLPFIEEHINNNKSTLPSNSDFAKIYFYRPKMVTGSLLGYKIRMDNDSVVCRVRNGEKCEVKIVDFGKHKFWAKIESRDSIIIDVEKGQEYFVRCAVGLGVFVGKPDFSLVDNHVARKEFQNMDK